MIQPLCLPSTKKYNKTTFEPSFSVSGVIGKFCFLCFLFMHIAWLLWRFSISLNFARSRVYCCELCSSRARMKSNERRMHKAKKCRVNCAMGVFSPPLPYSNPIRSKFVCKQIRDSEFRQPFLFLFLLVYTLFELALFCC